MTEIVNLRMARKRRARDDASERAERNRLAHGRTRARRDAARGEAERAARTLDGAKREPDPAGE